MSDSQVDVLVVGAGPVGLTAAAALARGGLNCRIIDKAPAPSDKSKALAVWCRTMELLDGLGLARTFVETGLKLSGGSIYGDGKRLVHLNLTSDESRFGFPLMIPQNETERILTGHLKQKGIAVERPVELLTFGETPGGVIATLRHADGREEQVTATWLVGCDGAHSTVRHALGMEFAGEAEPNDWMLADVHIDGLLARDEVSVYWHEKGVVAFFPIDRDRFRVIADLGLASEASAPAAVTLEAAQACVDERGPGGLVLSQPVWLANFRINERKVRDYRRGRVLLAGDAAHIHSPAGGQGMNTGMQDAFNLAWKIALVRSGRGRAEPLLDSYSLERSGVGDQVLKNAERFTALATLRSPVARWLRNHIAPILGSLDVVQDKMRNEWFELAINYRHSPLSVEDWSGGSSRVVAGDRLPDVPVRDVATGRFTSLSELLSSNRMSLLLLPGSQDPKSAAVLEPIAEEISRDMPELFSVLWILAPDADPRRVLPPKPDPDRIVWSDADGRLHERLHATGPAIVLVRPDGYIGYRSQPASLDGLRQYLDRFLIRPT